MSATQGIDWVDREVQFLKGAGPRMAALLGKLGIVSIGDLLLHPPSAYLDRRRIVSLAALESGTDATVLAHIEARQRRSPPGG